MEDILTRKLNDKHDARRSKEMADDNPRRISRTLATDKPPSTAEIFEGLKSRFHLPEYIPPSSDSE
jgi:hypothetical protein